MDNSDLRQSLRAKLLDAQQPDETVTCTPEHPICFAELILEDEGACETMSAADFASQYHLRHLSEAPNDTFHEGVFLDKNTGLLVRLSCTSGKNIPKNSGVHRLLPLARRLVHPLPKMITVRADAGANTCVLVHPHISGGSVLGKDHTMRGFFTPQTVWSAIAEVLSCLELFREHVPECLPHLSQNLRASIGPGGANSMQLWLCHPPEWHISSSREEDTSATLLKLAKCCRESAMGEEVANMIARTHDTGVRLHYARDRVAECAGRTHLVGAGTTTQTTEKSQPVWATATPVELDRLCKPTKVLSQRSMLPYPSKIYTATTPDGEEVVVCKETLLAEGSHILRESVFLHYASVIMAESSPFVEMVAHYFVEPSNRRALVQTQALVTRPFWGRPISTLLGRPLSPRQFWMLVAKLAKAVSTLHRFGLVHTRISDKTVLVGTETMGQLTSPHMDDVHIKLTEAHTCQPLSEAVASWILELGALALPKSVRTPPMLIEKPYSDLRAVMRLVQQLSEGMDPRIVERVRNISRGKVDLAVIESEAMDQVTVLTPTTNEPRLYVAGSSGRKDTTASHQLTNADQLDAMTVLGLRVNDAGFVGGFLTPEMEIEYLTWASEAPRSNENA